MDTKGRFHVHWGAAETYGERREESALRRSGRPVPDPTFERFPSVDLAVVDEILEDHDYDPSRMLSILEATQAAFGHLPVAALKRISERTGAWYAMIYGTASYYQHLRLGPAESEATGTNSAAGTDDAYLAALSTVAGSAAGGSPGAGPRAGTDDPLT
jgi:hypothetical protein